MMIPGQIIPMAFHIPPILNIFFFILIRFPPPIVINCNNITESIRDITSLDVPVSLGKLIPFSLDHMHLYPPIAGRLSYCCLIFNYVRVLGCLTILLLYKVLDIKCSIMPLFPAPHKGSFAPTETTAGILSFFTRNKFHVLSLSPTHSEVSDPKCLLGQLVVHICYDLFCAIQHQ